MSFSKILVITYCLLLVGACKSSAHTANPDKDSFDIVNIHVIDVADRKVDYKARVCIRKGIILNNTSAECTDTSSNVRVIDGQGGYLTPGLIDMHVHMFEKEGLMFALSHGVTHVRIMNGVSEQLKWRDDANEGRLLASTATVSSPIISGFEGAVLHHGLTTEDEARAAVQQYASQGYDLIKAYSNLSAEAFHGLMDESRKQGIAVAKDGPDVPKPLNIRNYSDVQSFEHMENIFYVALEREMTISKLDSFINEMKLTGAPITPTLNIFDQLTKLSVDKDAYLNELPQYYISSIVRLEDKNNQVKRWLDVSTEKAQYNVQVLEFLKVMTKAITDADIPLLIGTDSGILLSPHGIATHNEMRLFADAGIDTYSILQAATINASKALRLEDSIGQLKHGYYADFIFTLDNPISDITVLSNPIGVAKRGIYLNQERLNTLRDDAKSSKSLWAELAIFTEMMTR